MGTTVTLALVERGEVLIGHVGDSRAYRLRAGELEQLTQDHSLVGELMRSGKLSPEEAEAHPQRSVITRVLGTDPEVDVDVVRLDPQPGDLFLLCSDGLTSMVADEAIQQIVEQHRDDLDSAAGALVRTANRGGGEDNITVVFFELADGDGQETLPAPASERPPSPEDEDTLSGIERLEAEPAVDTMVVPPERVDEVFEGQAPRRGRKGRRALALLAVAILVAAFVLLLVWGLVR
jgi:protein phosphatase